MRPSAITTTILAAVALPAPLLAQNASVNGEVLDSQQARIPGAQVELSNTDTRVMVHVTADMHGEFILPPVTPGPYSVKVTAVGFAPTLVRGITLEAGGSKVLKLVLQAGATESVEVSAAPPELTTDRPDRSVTIEPVFVQNIPLNIRNPLQLINDAPGVTRGDDGLSGQNYTSESRTNTFRISGTKGSTTDTLIDGATNTTAYYNQDAGIPGVDSVRETRVFTDAYAPEYGRTSGGIVTYALRSGTDQLHGSAFEFFRNEIMDANGFNANQANLPRGSFGRNQFGFRIGGPVVLPRIYNGHAKTFFFFSYDGLRDTTAGSFTGTVPTALERTGDFSQTFDAQGNLITIYDPGTSTPNANGSNFTRKPLPGNKIDNPNALGLALLSLYPLPNQPGVGKSNVNNFFSNAPGTDDNNSYDTRIDHKFNDRHSIFGHYTDFTNRIHYNDFFGNGLSPEDADDRIPGKNIDVDHTWVISRDVIFEHHFSWAHSESNRDESVLKTPTSLGFGSAVAPGVTATLTPQLTISGATALGGESTLGNYYPLERNASSVWQYAANTSWVKKAHIFQFGLDLRRYPVQLWDPEQLSINAGIRFTNGPSTTTPAPAVDSGSGLAELLLGLATVTTGYEPETQSVHYYYGAYAQDTFKITPRLTATYGLRYGYETGDIEANNLLNYLDTQAPSPIAAQVPSFPNLKGGVGIPGLYGTSRQLQVPEKRHFDPRLGLTYELNDKTYVRAGFGIFHHPAAAWQQYPNADGGIRVSTSIDAQSNGVVPLAGYNLSNPFPLGLPTPFGDAAGLNIDLGQPIAGPPRQQAIPYQIQYSLDVERALPAGFFVTLAYVGNEGNHLMAPLQLNQIPDAFLAQGTQLTATVKNPFSGVITDPSSTLSTSNTTANQLLRPSPQFLNFDVINSGVGHSTYNAAQLTVEHRMKHGLAVLFAYTFSKALDNVGEMTSVAGTYTGFQDVYCPRCDKSRSDQDETDVVRWSTSYDLPFGRSRAFLSHGLGAAVLGGWTASTVYSFDSGRPLAVSATNNSHSFSGGGFRPNVVPGVSPTLPGGSPHGSHLTAGSTYFNPAAFTQPANFTFGNASRYLANINNPYSWNLDAMLEKNQHFGERYVVTFRGEAFNALNNVIFAGPTTSVSSPSFGKIASLSQTNTPRNVQVSARFTF